MRTITVWITGWIMLAFNRHFLASTLAGVTAIGFATHAAASLPSIPADTRAQPASRDGFVEAGNGVRLYYRMVGTGTDTVIVLQGGPGFSMAYLARDLEPLAAQHVLLFYDQRGTGRSTAVTDSASLVASRFADDLEAVRRHFGFSRVTLLAHSWGAAVAALYAERFADRIARLLVLDGISVRRPYHLRGMQTMEARRDSATQQRLRELGAARMASPGDSAACRAFYRVFFQATMSDRSALERSRGDFCAGSAEALANKVKSVDRITVPSLGEWDWRPVLHKVAAPALIVRGTGDHIPEESSREWTAALPNARFLSLDGAGHFPYLEMPTRVFEAARIFLAGSWPPGAEKIDNPAPPPM